MANFTVKSLPKKILLRIKKTDERDSETTIAMLFAAFLVSNLLAMIAILGVPNGVTTLSRVIDLLKAFALNSLVLAVATILFAIILSILFIPLPRLLVSGLLYTGALHFFILQTAKSGLSFSIIIGIITIIFTLLIGYLIKLMMTYGLARRILIIALIVLAAGLFAENLISKYTSEMTSGVTDISPATPGHYEAHFFTYGSGKDLYRKEFSTDVTEVTESVDASDFITKWSDKRTKFWGFSQNDFPINGRVWMPEGDGPFPVVLMVHGNHTMEYFSTAGYDYLGELLASRGFFFVSVDEDFVNYSNITGQPNDNYQLRAWLLLQHLLQLKELNEDINSQFYKKLNLNEVALAGHSRGGQAAAMAADYESFFDEEKLLANLAAFDIKAVIAVSPTDKLIDNKRANLENIAYMVMHGAQDADVSDFRGNQQFHRTTYSTATDSFKTAIYIERANHVHFNSSWGSYDLSLPKGIFLNRPNFLSKVEQQKIAKVYFTTFLEKVFYDRSSYDTFLQDPDSEKAWLPNTTIVNQYRTSAYRPLVEYFKNNEITGRLTGFNDSKITTATSRSNRHHPQDVLQLAWNKSAAYTINLSRADLLNLQANEASNLVVTVANTLPNTTPTMKLTLTADNGETVTKEKRLAEVIEVNYTLFGLFDNIFREGKYEQSWEPVFQTIALPLDKLTQQTMDKATLTIEFSTGVGEVMIEQIGID